MNLANTPTKTQLINLLAACNDNAGNHMLWVDRGGDVHLDLIPQGLTPVGYYHQTEAQQQFRYEAYVRGNGYVGPEAAANAAHVDELFDDLVTRWNRGDAGMAPYA